MGFWRSNKRPFVNVPCLTSGSYKISCPTNVDNLRLRLDIVVEDFREYKKGVLKTYSENKTGSTLFTD